VAAVVPISGPHPIAAGSRYKAVTIALAVSAVTALIGLIGPAPGADPAHDLRLQSRFSRTLLRQPPIARIAAVTGEGSAGHTCVMVLGKNGKLSVGFGELSRDTIVSLTTCDLHNASGEAGSTELLGGASLSARNIFLSGGYTLAAGAVMTALRHLTTHASPVADPYSPLEIPSYRGCTRTRYRLDRQKIETISPGVYCGGIEVAGGAILHLDPGTYILDRGDFVVAGNSTVSGTGVTLILTSRTRSNYGAVDFHAGSTIELTAPARGAAAGIPGIAIWADGNVPASSDTFGGGSTQNVNGAIYLPGRQVKYSGGSPSATRCSQLIARAVTFTGNSYFRHDCASLGLSETDPPLLLAE
jgi:hypothetical protein